MYLFQVRASLSPLSPCWPWACRSLSASSTERCAFIGRSTSSGGWNARRHWWPWAADPPLACLRAPRRAKGGRCALVPRGMRAEGRGGRLHRQGRAQMACWTAIRRCGLEEPGVPGECLESAWSAWTARGWKDWKAPVRDCQAPRPSPRTEAWPGWTGADPAGVCSL